MDRPEVTARGMGWSRMVACVAVVRQLTSCSKGVFVRDATQPTLATRHTSLSRAAA